MPSWDTVMDRASNSRVIAGLWKPPEFSAVHHSQQMCAWSCSSRVFPSASSRTPVTAASAYLSMSWPSENAAVVIFAGDSSVTVMKDSYWLSWQPPRAPQVARGRSGGQDAFVPGSPRRRAPRDAMIPPALHTGSANVASTRRRAWLRRARAVRSTGSRSST